MTIKTTTVSATLVSVDHRRRPRFFFPNGGDLSTGARFKPAADDVAFIDAGRSGPIRIEAGDYLNVFARLPDDWPDNRGAAYTFRNEHHVEAVTRYRVADGRTFDTRAEAVRASVALRLADRLRDAVPGLDEEDALRAATVALDHPDLIREALIDD